MKLKIKFALGVIFLLVVVVVGIGAMTVMSERRLLVSEMDQHQTQLITRLAKVCEESLYQNELSLLNYIQTLKAERGFVSAAYVNAEGKIQVHSDPNFIATPFKDETQTTERQFFVSLSAPVMYGSKNAGTAQILLSRRALQDFLNETLKQTLRRVAFISIIALIIGLIGAFWLARTLVAPIETIVSGMQEVAHGRLDPIPIPERTDEIGWMGQELNVTIHKLKELDEMKRDFVSGVTHELRSPLTAIERFVALLIKGTYGPLSSQQKDSLITVQNNTSRLMRFIDDLLTTAKLESRRVDLYCAQFDVGEPVKQVHKLFHPLAQEKGLSFKTEIPTGGALVWADLEKVMQILTNLVSNAFKFTQKGSVTIGVKDANDHVSVYVADTGPGISDEEKERLFDRFYRGKSTAQKVKGTGLGLSIVKGLVEVQGGAISVDGNPGGGSKFTFTLPKQAAKP